MTDTTVVGYHCSPANEYLMNRGYNAEMGACVIEYAPRNNADITSKGTKGWRPLGVLENVPKVNDSIETKDIEVGAITKTFASIQTGRKVTLPVSLLAPTMVGRKHANNSTVVVSYPTTPVNTTVDETTPVATTLSIVVASVTGLVAGDILEIVTGDSTYGTDLEYVKIKSIEVTPKKINFEQPIAQLPADGANVKKVASFKETALVCPTNMEYQYRLVRNYHTDESVEIQHFPNAQLKAISGSDSGDGKTANKYGFELSVNAEPVVTSGQITDYLLWTKERIY